MSVLTFYDWGMFVVGKVKLLIGLGEKKKAQQQDVEEKEIYSVTSEK
jgi:hypothetical protein